MVELLPMTFLSLSIFLLGNRLSGRNPRIFLLVESNPPRKQQTNLYKELFSALTPNKLLGFDAYLIIRERSENVSKLALY